MTPTALAGRWRFRAKIAHGLLKEFIDLAENGNESEEDLDSLVEGARNCVEEIEALEMAHHLEQESGR